jgi:glycosyltransferase involved in cell wall biosynthesis
VKIAIFQNMKFGGAMRASHEIAKGLALRGHELHLFRYQFGENRYDLYGVPKESKNPLNFSSIATIHELPDPRPRHHSSASILGWRIHKVIETKQLLSDLKSFERSAATDARAVDASSCEAVLLHLCCFTNAPLMLKYLQTPSLWFCHEPTRSLFETTKELMDMEMGCFNCLYRKRRRAVEASAASAAGTILCNSEFSREFIFRSYGIEAKVCRLGVDTEKFVPGNTPKKKQVICWGPLWAAKGLDFIIRSAARIPEMHRPKVVFPWSRGSEAYRVELEKLSTTLRVHVEFPKNLTDEELLVLIQESKVCVYAPRMELLGLVALEAMAAGLPVVGIREGGVRETVLDGKTGFLCARDENEFAGRLQILLENDGLREEMGHTASAYIRNEWTWGQTTERIEALIAGDKKYITSNSR